MNQFRAASDEEIDTLWEEIKKLDDTVTQQRHYHKLSFTGEEAARFLPESLQTSPLHVQSEKVHNSQLYGVQAPSSPG